MFHVYVLRDKLSGRLYTGHTDNLERRLWEHETHQSHYTAKRGPYELVHNEPYNTRSEAMIREKYLKSGKGRVELKEILTDI